jgi:murein DD-endopeptidase MepM/ murein hydrolase activator NlpD
MDFYAEEGAEVFAVYDGVVESVETTLLDGVNIVIDHENGLKTVYNSLADGDMVSVGDAVAKGEVIGAVSITNRQEYKSGAHLHFEVLENGKSINPLNYLTLPEK